VFPLGNTTNVHFCTFVRERFPTSRVMCLGSNNCTEEVQLPGNPIKSQSDHLNLNSDHNTAIRAEIGERLRVLLSKGQPRSPPRVQHLLDCLSTSDATQGRSRHRRGYLSWLKPRGATSLQWWWSRPREDQPAKPDPDTPIVTFGPNTCDFPYGPARPISRTPPAASDEAALQREVVAQRAPRRISLFFVRTAPI
jgi:hypothetical protein